MTKVPEKESPNDPAGSGIASSGERANITVAIPDFARFPSQHLKA